MTCTSYYEAPYTTQRVLGIKVSTREYTGDFNYDRMDSRTTATYDNVTREVGFRINSLGDMMITDSNTPIITAHRDLEAIETVKNIYSIYSTITGAAAAYVSLQYATFSTWLSGASTAGTGSAGTGTSAGAAAFDPYSAATLFVLSVYADIKLGDKVREQMREAIFEYMNNEAATFTKGVSDRFAITYGDAIKLQRYVSVMPAINHTILM